MWSFILSGIQTMREQGAALMLSLLIGLSLVLGGCGNTSGSDEESGREGTSPTEKETIESIVESLPDAPGESLSDGAEESLPEEEESMETAAGEYSTGGVWSEDGKLLYEDRFSTVSQETLEAMTTEEIFDVMMETVVARWHMSPLLYNFPSYLLTSMYEFFRTPEELMKRSDMVETVLEAYEEEELLLLLPVADSTEETYDAAELDDNQTRVVLEEILLATDTAFEQTDEETRRRILEAIMEKEAERQEMIARKQEMQEAGEEIMTGGMGIVRTSGFLGYIMEIHELEEGNEYINTLAEYGEGENKWYDYIMEEYGDEELKEYILSMEPFSWGPPF